MALKINEYRVRNGRTRLDETYFNKVFGDIDARIHAQETVEKDWQGAIREVTKNGLRRIDDFIGPAVTEIEQLTDLGFLQVRAAPDVDVAWQVGAQPIALALETEADRTRVKHFHPSPFIVVSDDADPATYLVARTLGLDLTKDATDTITEAVLRLDVVTVVGSPAGGTVLAPWCISSPAATALLVSTAEDAAAARDAAVAARDTTLGARDTAVAARDTTLGARDTAVAARDETEAFRGAAAVSAATAETTANAGVAVVVTGDRTAATGEVIVATGGTTQTLPDMPTPPYWVRFANGDDYKTRPLTIAPAAGQTINGVADDLLLDTTTARVGLVWNDAGDWRVA